MAGLSADYINPFIIASTKLLKDLCFMEVQMGKPYVKTEDFNNQSLVIMIEVTGAMKGQVMIDFEKDIACQVASKMTMMPINQLDDLSTSAVCELVNMILGNAATIFSTKGIGIDITPPSMLSGNFPCKSNICIPLLYENSKIEINIAVA